MTKVSIGNLQGIYVHAHVILTYVEMERTTYVIEFTAYNVHVLISYMTVHLFIRSVNFSNVV